MLKHKQIDPDNIVRRDYTQDELEELLIFCVCVAGKTAKTIAPRVRQMLEHMATFCPDHYTSPLAIMRHYCELTETELYARRERLINALQRAGIGTMTMKGAALFEVMYSIWSCDLDIVKAEKIGQVYGIGPKTSRFFVMAHRPESCYAALDTHILKWLTEQGVADVPKSTPTSEKIYRRLELEFLKRVPASTTPGEFDLQIWKQYRA